MPARTLPPHRDTAAAAVHAATLAWAATFDETLPGDYALLVRSTTLRYAATHDITDTGWVTDSALIVPLAWLRYANAYATTHRGDPTPDDLVLPVLEAALTHVYDAGELDLDEREDVITHLEDLITAAGRTGTTDLPLAPALAA